MPVCLWISLGCVHVPVMYLFSVHHFVYIYIDTNNCLVVRAWAWLLDCMRKVLGVYRCACYCVCLCIYGLLLAAYRGLFCTYFLYIIFTCMLIPVIGWLCAPGRVYMTTYDMFPVFTGVFTGACYIPLFCISFCICILILILGWLCAPGRGYMTVYDRFSVLTGVLVLYACAFMVFS